jgi:radical SAM superfamily enzyme YgiQ (UPF0313 family)
MQILLTDGYFLAEDAKEQLIMRPYPPLGILYISSYLEQNGFANEVFDSTFSSIVELQSYLLESRPDVVGIYTNLMTKLNVLKIIRFIKAEKRPFHTKLILGGPEVQSYCDNFLSYRPTSLYLEKGGYDARIN